MTAMAAMAAAAAMAAMAAPGGTGGSGDGGGLYVSGGAVTLNAGTVSGNQAGGGAGGQGGDGGHGGLGQWGGDGSASAAPLTYNIRRQRRHRRAGWHRRQRRPWRSRRQRRQWRRWRQRRARRQRGRRRSVRQRRVGDDQQHQLQRQYPGRGRPRRGRRLRAARGAASSPSPVRRPGRARGAAPDWAASAIMVTGPGPRRASPARTAPPAIPERPARPGPPRAPAAATCPDTYSGGIYVAGGSLRIHDAISVTGHLSPAGGSRADAMRRRRQPAEHRPDRRGQRRLDQDRQAQPQNDRRQAVPYQGQHPDQQGPDQPGRPEQPAAGHCRLHVQGPRERSGRVRSVPIRLIGPIGPCTGGRALRDLPEPLPATRSSTAPTRPAPVRLACAPGSPRAIREP